MLNDTDPRLTSPIDGSTPRWLRSLAPGKPLEKSLGVTPHRVRFVGRVGAFDVWFELEPAPTAERAVTGMVVLVIRKRKPADTAVRHTGTWFDRDPDGALHGKDDDVMLPFYEQCMIVELVNTYVATIIDDND